MVRRVEGQIEDVLASVDLVHRNHHLEDELFGTLVELLLEHVLLELAVDVARHALSVGDYETQVRELADQCRRTGLLSPR